MDQGKLDSSSWTRENWTGLVGPGKNGQDQLDQGKLDRFSWTWEKWTGPFSMKKEEKENSLYPVGDGEVILI